MSSSEHEMSQVEIVDEAEERGRWRFVAQLLDDAGGFHRVTMTLMWSDYNLWSPAGADTPAAVASAVLRFIASRQPAGDLPARFDASYARRLDRDADEGIPRLIA